MFKKKKPKKKFAVKKPAVKTAKQYKKELDDLWGKCIRSVGKCEICGSTTRLNAHHLISRKHLRYRWDLSNGICLCSNHHVFSDKISPHGGSFKSAASVHNFLEWLKTNRQGQYQFFLANKDDKKECRLTNAEYEYIKTELTKCLKKENIE